MENRQSNRTPEVVQTSPLLSRLLKVLGYAIVFIFGLLIGLYAILQIEAVQNWTVQKTTTYLSKELQTTVTLDRIYFDFFDKLVLENFYVEDFHEDTLLFSKALTVNLNTSLYQIFQRQLEIEDIALSNARLYMRRYSGEQKDDFAQLMDKLSGVGDKPKKGKKESPFFLNIKALYLETVEFIKEDSVGGEELRVALSKGEILIDELNLVEKIICAPRVDFSEPYVTLINFPKSPLPPDTATTEVIAEKALPDSTKKKWRISIVDFLLANGTFIHHNYRKSPAKTSSSKQIDYNHLNVFDINIHVEDFIINDWTFSGKSKKFSLKEGSGFQLSNLIAEQVVIAPNQVELYSMALITPYSYLGDTLTMKFKGYSDFKDFPDKVRMKGKFNQAHISIRDIIAFAPALNNNTFFAQNKREVFYLDGRIRGRINNLDLRDFHIRLGKSASLRGDFGFRNLTQSDEMLLDLKLKRLQSSMVTLRQLIPNFNPPANFDKLGKLDFEGRFYGFLNAFSANGTLKSDLGLAQMDMSLNTKEGREQATYSGQLSLIDFDLARWADNDNFGLVTFQSKVKEGVGLTSETVHAKLNASIDRFPFKGYNYEHLAMKGEINKNLFKGDFAIKDDNIDFSFDGTIDFEGKEPAFDFAAAVKSVNLQALNLAKKDFVVGGDIQLNLRGKSLDELKGWALLYGATVKHDSVEYSIDSLKFYASSATKEKLPGTDIRKKTWRLNSELFKANLVGGFNIATIKEAILQFTEKNYPAYADRFNIHSKGDTTLEHNQFAFDLKIIDTKNFTQLLNKDLDTLKNIDLYAYFDFARDTFLLDLDVPTFKYGNLRTKKIKLYSEGVRKQSKVDLSVQNAKIEQLNFDYISLLTYIKNDSAEFNINTADISHELDQLNLEGLFFMEEDLFNIRLIPSNLVFLNTVWNIEEDNFIRIGKNFIQTQNFQITHENQRIAFNSLLDRGLELEVRGFNANYIDVLWDYDKLDFEGIYHIRLSVEDLFALEKIRLNAIVDTFYINEDKYGKLELNVLADNLKSPANIHLSTQEGSQQMDLKGYYNLPNMKNQPNYFDVGVDIKSYPLKLAEYFVTEGITNTVGKIDALLTLKGTFSDPDLDGTIRVFEGATTIDYIGTRYTIIDETVKMNNEYLLDATGGTIHDKHGNSARLTGGITHDFFKNLALNCRVESDHFLILNTTKENNPVYYGTGIGRGEITFSGDFNRTDIDIKAVTARGTRISIPVSSESTLEEVSFIRFEKKDTAAAVKSEEELKVKELKGVKLDMELAMNNDAEVLLIFDEKVGDIMRGRGAGTVRMEMSRLGNISMYGDYEIEEGDYLFTLFNLVNKPFSVKRGGTINWAGDPYNALININAEYKGLNAAPYNFIIEYLTIDNEKAEARQATLVDLTMNLTGQLLRPNIAFDLNFPNLTGEIKNYTDSKIRAIQLDQNELNRQVFGLIVIGGFLPADQGALQGRELLTGINTLSELLSNQLSIYLTELLSEAISGVNFLNLEDFDVAYNVYDVSSFENPNNLGTGHEVYIRQKYRVKDRWTVNIAGNFDLGGSYINNSNEALVTGDFIIEYEITKDRRLKIRGYYKNEPEIFGGRRNNAGLGLSFRREFDDFEDLLSFLKKSSAIKPQTLKEGGD